MDYTVETLSPIRKRVRVKVEREIFLKKSEEILKEIQQNVVMRGFRRGKVPIEIIKAQFGEAIKRETMEKIVRETLKSILEKERLVPVSTPSLEEIETEKEVKYTVSFETLPELEPKGYHKIKVKIKKETVSEEDIENALKNLRERNSVLEPVEDRSTIKEGDIILIDLLSEGRKTYFKVEKDDEFDGREKGEIVKLEGNKAKILNIYKQIIPDLNDEFAKTLGVENVEKLIENVKQELEVKAEEDTKNRKFSAIFEVLRKENPFPVPPSMIEEEYHTLKERLQIKDESSELKNIAEKRIRENILIFAIAKKENIKVEEKEIEEELKKVARDMKKRVEELKFKNPELKSGLKDNIMRKKVLEMLEKNTEVEYE